MQSLASLLTARVEAAAGIDPEMRPATKPQFGHFQSNVALRLAKTEGRPPRDVAADLVGRIEVDDLCEPLEVAGPGFINFRIRASVLAQAATDLLGDSIATNLFMLGYAWQRGLVPLSRQAIERAIEINGAAVDANKANQAELETIKGIGPGLSAKILDARKAGAFKDWNDLVDRVGGVGPGNAAKFSQAGLTVNNAGYDGSAPAAKAPVKAAKADKIDKTDKTDKTVTKAAPAAPVRQ